MCIYVCVSVNVWYMCEIAYFKLWYYWVILKMKDLFLRDVTFLRSSHISNLKYVINFEFSFPRFCSDFTKVQHIDNISFEIIYKVQEICAFSISSNTNIDMKYNIFIFHFWNPSYNFEQTNLRSKNRWKVTYTNVYPSTECTSLCANASRLYS